MVQYKNNKIKVNTIAKPKTNERIISKNIVSYLAVILPISFSIIFLAFANHISYTKLANISKNNYAIEMEIKALNEEKSALEEEIQKLLDIKELKRKAIEQGFEYNKKINYI